MVDVEAHARRERKRRQLIRDCVALGANAAEISTLRLQPLFELRWKLLHGATRTPHPAGR